jgi:hypothetical protein
MQTTRSNAWTRTAPGALFAGSIQGGADCVVVAGAAAVAGLGAVAMVALIVPGSVHGRVLVLPNA